MVLEAASQKVNMIGEAQYTAQAAQWPEQTGEASQCAAAACTGGLLVDFSFLVTEGEGDWEGTHAAVVLCLPGWQ